MGKGGKKEVQTVQTGPDVQSQAYINALRKQAMMGSQVATGMPGSMFAGPLGAQDIQAAMNPFLSQVVDATRGEFDNLRGLASNATNQQATQAGAFGGSRQAVLEGTRLGELDRAQASNIAGLLSGGYGQAVNLAEMQRQQRQQQLQEPLWRQQQALNMLNLGMGPVGQSQQQFQPRGSALGSAASGALAGSAFGPIGGIVGGGLGLLGGLFG